MKRNMLAEVLIAAMRRSLLCEVKFFSAEICDRNLFIALPPLMKNSEADVRNDAASRWLAAKCEGMRQKWLAECTAGFNRREWRRPAFRCRGRREYDFRNEIVAHARHHFDGTKWPLAHASGGMAKLAISASNNALTTSTLALYTNMRSVWMVARDDVHQPCAAAVVIISHRGGGTIKTSSEPQNERNAKIESVVFFDS